MGLKCFFLREIKALSFQKYTEDLSTPASLAIGCIFSPFITLYITSYLSRKSVG